MDVSDGVKDCRTGADSPKSAMGDGEFHRRISCRPRALERIHHKKLAWQAARAELSRRQGVDDTGGVKDCPTGADSRKSATGDGESSTFGTSCR